MDTKSINQPAGQPEELHAGDVGFYRPAPSRPAPAAPEYSTQELRERAELTGRIAADLEIIRGVNLEEVARRVASLATALRLVRELDAELSLKKEQADV